MDMLTLDDLTTIAKEIDLIDSKDWKDLSINPDQAYRLVASSMLEYYSELDTDQDRIQMLLITAVRLTVENFVLNLKLLKQENESKI